VSKTYKVIAKVSGDKFVKYNTGNLISFTNFLDANYKDWRWFNVYVYNKKTKVQIASFTKYNRAKLKNTPSIR